MIRNTIIALQTIIIVLGLLWAGNYQNRMEQIFYSNHLRIMANDILLLSDLNTRIASGKSEEAQKTISAKVPAIINEMEQIIGNQIDPKMEDTFTEATQAGSSLNAIGIHQASAAFRRRFYEESKIHTGFHPFDPYIHSGTTETFAWLVGEAVLFLLLLSFPISVAWFIGRKTVIRTPSRSSFLTACILLTYGVTALASVTFYFPLDVANTDFASQLSANGHPLIARTIFVIEDWFPFTMLIVFVMSAFVIPFRLRHSWEATVAAYGANNSFNPTAGVGPGISDI
jgi:hypothetical protein